MSAAGTTAIAAAPGRTPASSAPLADIVITAVRMQTPATVVTDPQRPRQPVPAQDGADYLRSIPGFASVRKGGTGADPVFRGMAASRVAVLVDGEQTLGGCGMRMDPPTAYVYPEAYDRIVVVKGPQTVLYGPGNSAATVLFERTRPSFDSPGLRADGSALAAAFGRYDVVGDATLGAPAGSARLTATHARQDDYDDGDGRAVHSAYSRWSTNAALAWTPNADASVELTGAFSDGEAAYADRAMDGAKFERRNVGLRASLAGGDGWLRNLELRAYHNYVDHVMDNYSLRGFTATPMMPGQSASNPDRRTDGVRLAADLVRGTLQATVGVDAQENRHRLRGTMNETTMPYEAMARVEDARFRNVGAFGELRYAPGRRDRLVAGARADRWYARDSRATLALGMTTVANPTAGAERHATLPGGFARLEHSLANDTATAYAGLGHVARFPDYWELVGNGRESTTSPTAFGTRPERTTQLDLGFVQHTARAQWSVSAYAARVSNYVLVETGYMKGMRSASVVRNVDARTLGAEADARYALATSWNVTGTLAYARGTNRTDDLPLAQMPPLELRTGIGYDDGRWSAGALARLVSAQKRVAPGQGTIVGQDLGPTGGYAVFALHAGWRATRALEISAGVDNLLDRTYAEHLSRGGAEVSGFERFARVNEPGRVVWLKAGARLGGR
jgi:iron complex outermembrane receptor protein